MSRLRGLDERIEGIQQTSGEVLCRRCCLSAAKAIPVLGRWRVRRWWRRWVMRTFKNGRQLAAWVGLSAASTQYRRQAAFAGNQQNGDKHQGTADPWCPCGDPIRRGQGEDRSVAGSFVCRLAGTNVATVALPTNWREWPGWCPVARKLPSVRLADGELN